MKKPFALMAAMILLISGFGSAEVPLVESEDPMANIPQIKIDGNVYNLKDAEAQEQISVLKGTLSDICGWTNFYLPETVIPAEDKNYDHPVSIKQSIYTRKLLIKDSGSGGYYGYGLYNGGTLVWGSGPDESGLIWIPAGTTMELEVPLNIEADSFYFRNRNARTGTTVKIISVGNDYPDYIDHQSIIHYLRRISMQPVSIGIDVGNGATKDDATKTITIPSGSTGNNSYFTIGFSWADIFKYDYSSQEGVLLLALKCSAPSESLKPLIWYTTNQESSISKLIGVFNEDIYLYEVRFTFPAVLSQTSNEFFYCQLKNTESMSVNTTIQLISATIEWDGYNQAIIDGLKNVLIKAPTETILTVGNGKQYTSLRTALEYAARISSPIKHVTVQYYGNGTNYNLMNDITPADLTAGSSFIGLVVPANCKLLGMGSREQNKVSLTLPSGTDSDVAFRISTVNLVENAELENMWFYGNGCRYACHDDTQTYNPEWTLKTIRNCRFTSDYTNQHRSYGAGYRSGVNWRFENCIFENINGEETEFGNAAFSAHNNSAMSKAANITFVNCYASGGHAFGFESLNRTEGQDYANAKTMISFYGCKGVTHKWDRPIQTSIPAADAQLEVCVTGFGNNFGNDDVAVYYNGDYYNDRFADQLTLWGKITEPAQ